MLSLEDVRVHYGGVQAVRGVSLEVRGGQVVGLVGANGAGKTSVLNAIMGLVPHSGRVSLEGASLDACKTADIVRRGVIQVAQGRQLFADMTVLENLELGAFLQPPAQVQEGLERMFVQFPVLKSRAAQRAGTLSGGEQQMVAMARALMSRPKLMLMDEPSMGLAPILVERSFGIIKQVHEAGVAVLVVEQNANVSLSIADRGYVLSTGRLVLEGKASELLEHEDLRKAYLGR